jgi:hypothetical protein
MTNEYERAIREVYRQPHKLGWLIGKDKLTPLHSEWIRYCWDSDEPRALQAFRGGYKTTAIGVAGAIRWMLFHPDDRIAVIRKNYQDAADVARTIASAMDREEVAALFHAAYGIIPKARTRREGDLIYSFKTTDTPEGNITALGIESGITGAHFDKILCDDIITLKDRVSRAERGRTAEVVRELAANIIEPGKGSVWIGTPWHRDDAWRVINRFCAIAKYPISAYNFIGQEELERKRLATTPYLFAANYELELGKDESLLFTDPLYSAGWDFSVNGVFAHLDAAFDGADYCALTIASPVRKEDSHSVYQTVGFTYAGNVKVWIPEVIRLCRKYKVRAVYTESNADHGYTADKLAESGIRAKTYPERQNKYIKIATNLFEVWRYLEWAPETDAEYMNQILDYRRGSSPDDAPDSAASLFREAFPLKKNSLERWQW